MTNDEGLKPEGAPERSSKAGADSDDPGQGFQFEGGHHSNRRRAVLPVGTFMGSQRW
jgi:hypothetical protein